MTTKFTEFAKLASETVDSAFAATAEQRKRAEKAEAELARYKTAIAGTVPALKVAGMLPDAASETALGEAEGVATLLKSAADDRVRLWKESEAHRKTAAANTGLNLGTADDPPKKVPAPAPGDRKTAAFIASREALSELTNRI